MLFRCSVYHNLSKHYYIIIKPIKNIRLIHEAKNTIKQKIDISNIIFKLKDITSEYYLVPDIDYDTFQNPKASAEWS